MIPNWNFLKINILQVVMFQNVLMDPRYWKRNKALYFLKCLLESLCPFKKKLNLCVFPISYTCLNVISYKCKYALFHLNMLRLFQEINMFFFFEIKLVYNKNFSLKYLIQGFNPDLLTWFVMTICVLAITYSVLW